MGIRKMSVVIHILEDVAMLGTSKGAEAPCLLNVWSHVMFSSQEKML